MQSLFFICPNPSPRINFIVDFLGQHFIANPITIKHSTNQVPSDALKVFYDPYPQKHKEPFTFNPPVAHILFEKNVKPQKITWQRIKFNEEYFKLPLINNVPDWLATGFYLLTAYAEYTSPHKDNLGRYDLTATYPANWQNFKIPLADAALHIWSQQLCAFFPEVKLKKNRARFLPTFDIDNATAYKHKGFGFNLAVSAYLFFKKPTINIKRFKVLLGLEQDPYDNFEAIHNLLNQYKLEAIFFFLLADKGPYDKNLKHTNPAIVRLIHKLQLHYTIGIHPGVAAAYDAARIKIEKHRLEIITQQKITNSRQHYLKFNFPDYFCRIESAGIKNDYSVGFAQTFGFRLGTCHSVAFFNLHTNRQHPITLHPFALMDASLKHYLKLTPQQSTKVVDSIIRWYKIFGGTFTPLLHNEIFSYQGPWAGWQVFIKHLFNTGTTLH